jgi:hypothetical protein
VEKFIAQCNISRFEELLRNESDPKERGILEAMLREERDRLAAAEAQPKIVTQYRFVPDQDRVPC